MYNNDVLLTTCTFQLKNTVPDGFLGSPAAGYNPLKLIYIKLLRISPYHIMPAVNAHQPDGVNLGMFLESHKGINQYGLIIHMDKLLGNILA